MENGGRPRSARTPLTAGGPQVTSRKYPQLKEVDDVLGGAAAWENVDSTAGRGRGASGAGPGRALRPLTAPRPPPRRAVPQVRAPPRLLHADPDALGRRAHDHLLQVLQPPVRPPLEGLSPPHTSGPAQAEGAPAWSCPGARLAAAALAIKLAVSGNTRVVWCLESR